MSQNRDQQHNLRRADSHELIAPQRVMQPFIVHVNEKLNPRSNLFSLKT